MKLLAVALTLLIALSFTFRTGTTLSASEREFGVKYLTDTENDFIKATKGLTEAQLNFKPGPDRWSIAECMEHIAITEKKLFELSTGVLDKPSDPAKRKEIKFTEAEIIQKMTDRSEKFKTMEMLKPTHALTTAATITSFEDQRHKAIEFIKTTQLDLRDHFSSHPLFGTLDTYQFIILMAAHGERHTLQIEEVKADPGFPH